MTVCGKRPLPHCVVSAQRRAAFVVGLFTALTPDVSVSHRMKNSCCGGPPLRPGEKCSPYCMCLLGSVAMVMARLIGQDRT